MYNFEVGLVLSMIIFNNEKDIYEYLIECPDKSVKKFYLKGETLQVGQNVRMNFNDEDKEYNLLGIL